MRRHAMGALVRLAMVVGGVSAANWLAVAEAAGQQTTSRFYDRGLLAAAVLMNEQAAVEQAGAQLAAAVEAFEHASASLGALRAGLNTLQQDDSVWAEKLTEAEGLQKVVDGPLANAVIAAEADLAAAQEALAVEQAEAASWLTAIRDGQVFAFNRALDTTRASKLTIRLNAAELQAAIAGQYDNRQISLLIRALTEEAKYLAHADAFTAKAMETNNSRFLEIAGRMRRRAADQKEKYLSRINAAAEGQPKVVSISTDDTHGVVQEQRMLAREAVLESRAAARVTAQP